MENRSQQICNNDAVVDVARSAEVVLVGEGIGAAPEGDNNMAREANAFENVEPNLRNPEEYMPIANIVRIMRRALPAHAKVSEDVKETMQECLTQFISVVTKEANAKCQDEWRRTITAEDLVSAMGALGFDDYLQPLCDYMNQYREQVPGRRARGNAPQQMSPPVYYEVDPELPPRADGGEGSSGGEPSAWGGGLNSE